MKVSFTGSSRRSDGSDYNAKEVGNFFSDFFSWIWSFGETVWCMIVAGIGIGVAVVSLLRMLKAK